MIVARYVLAAVAALLAAPVQAMVQDQSEDHFVIRHVVTVPASPEETWVRLLNPAQWWSSEHSYSGDAANLSLDPRAGGCFCETLPSADGAEPRGSVEHMRVVYVERPRALRMEGGLGPLQSESLLGKLTIFLKPGEAGTQILFEYVVAGHFRQPVAAIAPAVDAVLGQQILRLGAGLGARVEAPAPDAAGSGDVSEFDREMEAITDGEVPREEPAAEADATEEEPAPQIIGR